MDPPFPYRVHSHNSRTGEDDGLRFLSREEQECLHFFEKTIDSLEESLEENEQQAEHVRPTARRGGVQEVDGHLSSSPSPSAMLSTLQSRFHSSKDHDIIDLVRPQPNLVQSRAMDFNATSPDFLNMVPAPGSHLEMKPRHNPTDSLPSENSVAVPSGNFGSTDSQTLPYHPPGCVPTPVLIAQKIAENQPGGASNSQSSLVHRRWSEEYEKPSSPSTDLPSKQGPPTSAKSTRYPANINVILGSKEHQSHSLSNVNLQQRRAQMLANLTGSHPLLQQEANYTAEEKAHDGPRRSISFRDPTPDKSRLEALSKLGLTRNRAMSGGLSLPATPKNPSPETDGRPLEMNAPGSSMTVPQVNVTTSNQNQASVERNSEIPKRHSFRRDSMSNLLPPTVPETNYEPAAVPQTNYQPTAVPLTNYQPAAVPQTNYQPAAVPQTNYQPAAVPQANYQPAVPQTNYQPAAVPQANYQPAVPQPNYQPAAVPQTNYQPAAVPQTNYQPVAVPQTNYQTPSVPKTNYQPEAVPQTNYQPAAVPQTNYQPVAVPQTNYQPAAVPQTNYQTPSVPKTNSQTPSVPKTNYQPAAVPQTNYQTPSVPKTNYQPAAVPQTNYQTPSVPKTNYQPVAVPQTNYQPAAVPQTKYQTPSVPKTNYQPAVVPQTNHQISAVPKTSLQPPPVPQTTSHPPPLETTASVPPHPEVTPPEFNSYGGKSILVKPTTPPKTETPASPTIPDPKVLPPALSNPTEFNTYGGKSKTINPAPAVIKRNDLPDILSSHMDKTQTLPGRSDPSPPESSAYIERGHSRNHPPNLTTKSVKAPAPTPAPRPPRNSTHGPVSTQKPAQRALSPQYRRKPASMFPSHGVTVQFSGRGATEESRKDALRKLGLLKDS